MRNSLANDQQKVWNESSKTIPLDKDPSAYAIEREKEFPRGSVVCDLGGGTGVDTLYFLQNGHSVILVDISDYALKVAEKMAESKGLRNKLTLVQSDLSLGILPIESGSCNVVYSRLSLHYFFPKVMISLFKEILRILKKNGVAFITIKSYKDEKEIAFLRETAKEIEREVFDDNGQIKARYSEKRLGEMLERADVGKFKIIDYEESFVGRKDRVKSGLEKLLLLEIRIKK